MDGKMLKQGVGKVINMAADLPPDYKHNLDNKTLKICMYKLFYRSCD